MRGPDRSGPLRLGALRPAERRAAVADLPALATIRAFMAQRPAWAASDPFPVSSEMFTVAESEMREQMKRRGFPLPLSGDLARDGVRHFLLHGVPIVMEAQIDG